MDSDYDVAKDTQIPYLDNIKKDFLRTTIYTYNIHWRIATFEFKKITTLTCNLESYTLAFDIMNKQHIQ